MSEKPVFGATTGAEALVTHEVSMLTKVHLGTTDGFGGGVGFGLGVGSV